MHGILHLALYCCQFNIEINAVLLLSNPCFAVGQKVLKYADVRESILKFLLRENLSLHSVHLKFAPPLTHSVLTAVYNH